MILQALTAYYEQLLKQGKVEAPGWDSRFKVSYELRLGPDGQLLALNDLRQEVPKGKKTVIAPRELPVPHRVKRASGVAANFLCDNTSYLLGADEKGKPERSRQCFEACAALHHKVLDGVDSPAAKAILAFFDSWVPDTAPTHPLLAEQWADLNNNANLVFGYESPDGAHWLATTDDAIRTAWQSAFDTSDADAETARCLITGKEAGIARIHPAIKGVMGAQAAGAALVSFNAPAFCSYGHEQGANAPVSEYAAFAYTTALNLLLADRNCCQRIGDTTIVCWAENAAPAYSNAMLMFFCGGAEARGVSESDLAAALKALSQGRPVSFLDDKLDPNQNFCWASRPTRPGSPSGSSCTAASDSLPKICRTTPTGSASPAPPSTSGKTCRSGRWRRRRSTRNPGTKIHRPSWWAICSGPSSPAGRTPPLCSTA